MEQKIYHSTQVCPVCNKTIEVTKVRSKAVKVVSRDSDFCTRYEDINPIFYEAWVCEYCGYASLAEQFDKLSYKHAKIIKEKISSKWNQRSFKGERNINEALEAFKLALLNAQLIGAKSSELAKICIRIAWLYRLKGDTKEKEFLNFALKCYSTAYENENLTADKLDDTTCAYMIAELNRRMGSFEESIKWFSKLISSPEARKNKMLMDQIRDQFQLAKDQSSE